MATNAFRRLVALKRRNPTHPTRNNKMCRIMVLPLFFPRTHQSQSTLVRKQNNPDCGWWLYFWKSFFPKGPIARRCLPVNAGFAPLVESPSLGSVQISTAPMSYFHFIIPVSDGEAIITSNTVSQIQ